MILEELVSKLGFEVEGLNKLRAARKEFERTKKSAVATNKTLVATSRGTAVAATGVSRLGTALRTILGVFARLITVAAGVAAGVALVGTAFVIAGVRAAKARREFVLTAKEMGTTGQNLETLGNILRVAGFGEGFEEEAKKVVGAIDEISKSVRKGGEDADEAKKKFQGFGIDKSFDIDPKTGKSRDSAAVALDIFQAYKRATEQAAALRSEADAIATKSPRKAASLRKKALGQEQKTEQFAEDAGVSGRLRVLLDNTALKDFPELLRKAASWFPTTSNASESAQGDVAKQAQDAGLKASALLKGTTDRLTELGIALSTHVLPPLNNFLDGVISFAKNIGLIKETVKERRDRESYEAASKRAEGMRAERLTTEDLQSRADASQKRYEESIKSKSERMKQIRQQLSPEASAAKMLGTAQASTDNRKYENIGNDQRTISPSITVQASGLDAVAAAVKNAVLGAISTKGANTSTGALTAP